MNGKQLKNSILQWAIQGKLVPQDPNDEPASALLERIRLEKQRLIKEGKLKKDKNETIIYRGDDNSHYEKNLATGLVKCIDDEIPFEIPATWQWVRFGVIAKLIMGKTPPRGDNRYWEKGVYNWVSISDMTDNGLITKTKEKVSQIAFSEVFANRTSNKGDLLMSFKLTVGRTSILDIEACHNEAIITILPYVENDFALRNYLFYTLPLLANLGNSKDAIKGKTLNSKSLNNLLLPLPNFAEQQRIVAKIEELLPYIEKYSEAQDRLDNLNGSINDLLRKSILQEAIQGRLVPQVAEEDSAETLLQLIIDEKQKLVKAGKLKAKEITDSTIFKGDDNKYYEKVGTVITCIEDELPFDIPDNWAWVRLGDLLSARSGLAYNKENLEQKAENMVRVLRGGNITNGGWSCKADDVMIAPDFVREELYLKKGTFITPAVTSLEHMGKTALIREDYDNMVAGGFVLMLSPFVYNEIIIEYLAYYFQSAHYKEFCQSITHKSGQAFYNISRQKLLQHLVPIPPKPEIQRICDKLDVVLASIMSR